MRVAGSLFHDLVTVSAVMPLLYFCAEAVWCWGLSSWVPVGAESKGDSGLRGIKSSQTTAWTVNCCCLGRLTTERCGVLISDSQWKIWKWWTMMDLSGKLPFIDIIHTWGDRIFWYWWLAGVQLDSGSAETGENASPWPSGFWDPSNGFNSGAMDRTASTEEAASYQCLSLSTTSEKALVIRRCFAVDLG